MIADHLLTRLDQLGPTWAGKDLQAERVAVEARLGAIQPDDDKAITAAIGDWSQRLRELGG